MSTSRRSPLSRTALPQALALAAAISACDGALTIEGRVFERPAGDTLAPSIAVVDAKSPDTTGLRPLPDAVVWIYHHAADTANPRPDTMLYVEQEMTGGDGSFYSSGTASPWPGTAALGVFRTGYRGVEVPFAHDGKVHHAVVILTPRSAPSPR